jgi:imidazolonepropionase
MNDLAVLNIRQLVTLAGAPGARTGPAMRELAIIPDGAMRIRDGRIAAVGPRADIARSLAEDTAVVDAGWRIVLPGFIDAHTHPVFAGTRAAEFERRTEGATYAEIAAAGGGIRYTEWFLRGGTTTIEAKSGYGLSADDELRILKTIRLLNAERRLRYIPTFLGAHEIPDEYRGEIEDYVDLVIEEMLPRVVEDNLAESCDVFCEPNVFPVDESRRILRAAQSMGLNLRIHADQFTGDYASMLAAELGAATADHLESTSAAGIDALAAAGVQPVLLPASVYNLGSTHYPAARAMIDRGMAVVLATDFNPGSSPTASIPMVLSLAATQMKMTPAESITAVTMNAAASLGRARQLGSLEPGKAADFAIHECDDYRELPYFFGREPAYAVYLAGECVYRRGS